METDTPVDNPDDPSNPETPVNVAVIKFDLPDK